jgi:hypothetical protein
MNGEKNYKKRIKKEKRRKIFPRLSSAPATRDEIKFTAVNRRVEVIRDRGGAVRFVLDQSMNGKCAGSPQLTSVQQF